MASARHRVRRVATGPVAIGNAGSGQRLNHTIVGDTENLATHPDVESRICGTTILVTEDAARAAGPDGFDPAGPVTVRGRHVATVVRTPKQPST